MSFVYIEPGRVTQWEKKKKTMGHVLGLGEVHISDSTQLFFVLTSTKWEPAGRHYFVHLIDASRSVLFLTLFAIFNIEVLSNPVNNQC